jgi:hypothetical protein
MQTPLTEEAARSLADAFVTILTHFGPDAVHFTVGGAARAGKIAKSEAVRVCSSGGRMSVPFMSEPGVPSDLKCGDPMTRDDTGSWRISRPGERSMGSFAAWAPGGRVTIDLKPYGIASVEETREPADVDNCEQVRARLESHNERINDAHVGIDDLCKRVRKLERDAHVPYDYGPLTRRVTAIESEIAGSSPPTGVLSSIKERLENLESGDVFANREKAAAFDHLATVLGQHFTQDVSIRRDELRKLLKRGEAFGHVMDATQDLLSEGHWPPELFAEQAITLMRHGEASRLDLARAEQMIRIELHLFPDSMKTAASARQVADHILARPGAVIPKP